MEEEVSIYLMPYTYEKLHEIKGWEGLISQEGDFYKVCPKFNLEAAHEAFAEAYASIKLRKNIQEEYEKLKKLKQGLAHINLSKKDILINMFGFVSFDIKVGGADVKAPSMEYCGYKITNNQLKTVCKLMDINGYQINQISGIKGIMHSNFHDPDLHRLR